MVASGAQTIEQALLSRRSVRGFLPDPVAHDVLLRILRAAGNAPSGSNIQPWRVHVVRGQSLVALSQKLVAAHEAGCQPRPEYHYYPTKWRSPYIDRRRENGWGLYGVLGIQKGDYEASAQQHRRNYYFFDAPLALFFTIDDDLELGSWLDYGMFLQSIMVAARGHGLHTCPQQALVNYPDIVRQELQIPAHRQLICGMSMGYENPDAPANQFRTTRIPLTEFVQFHE